MNNLRLLLFSLLFAVFLQGYGQEKVPYGISYQAVARDNFGKELVNGDIDVKFSILSPNPLGVVVYQEIHSHIITSRYGVFSLVIGHGTPTEGVYPSFSEIKWGEAFHYLKVEVKVQNNFIDMGTMQFLAVPYALYAQKSLEPGPQGPKGDPGNEASDDQTLSFNGSNLSISGGNTVNLSELRVPHQLSIIGDTLSILGGNSIGLLNQIQDLQLDINNKLKITKNASATEIDLTRFLDDKQQLNYDILNNKLSISGGNTVDLSPMKQDLALNGNLLTITNKATPAQIDLSKYIQNLIFNSSTNKLQIGGGNEVDLTALKDNTDNQTLTYNASANTLSITNGGSVSLGNMVAFRAKKIVEDTGLTLSTDYDFVTPVIEFNDGSGFNGTTGIFTAPVSGIYTFIIGYNAGYFGDLKTLKISLNGNVYDVLNSNISMGSSLTRSITLKLLAGDIVKVIVNIGSNNGLGFGSGTGSFSGFKVY